MARDLREPLLPACPGGQGIAALEQRDTCTDTSLRKLGAADDGNEATVTGSEIRAAAVTCSPDFCLHDCGIFAPGKELDARVVNPEQKLLDEVLRRVQALNEEEIKELLFDHVGLNCCLGDNPAAHWKVQRVENCSAYVGTLETFVEERVIEEEVEPYTGDFVDGLDKGRMPDAWEMDMKAEIPLLFVSEKEVRRKVPNSEVVKICGDCLGYGKLVCTPPKPALFMKCGRGSSGTRSGKAHEEAQNWIRCGNCHGQGALLYRKVLKVRWRTILLKRVCATKRAKSVPDEVFHRVKGVYLYQSQNYQCEPACFSMSDSLSRFSESVISGRAFIPDSARIICERHQLSLIPVTRVVMGKKRKSFKLYILGVSREVFMDDYPAGFFSLCGICNIC